MSINQDDQTDKQTPGGYDDFVSQFLKAGDPANSVEQTKTDVEQQTASITDMVLEQQIVDALRGVYDPEIPLNIYDLGLIYAVRIDEQRNVNIDMTLTSPGCPVAQTFPGTVECAVKCVEGVRDVHVELVWDPPWTKQRMSEDALLSLGLL